MNATRAVVRLPGRVREVKLTSFTSPPSAEVRAERDACEAALREAGARAEREKLTPAARALEAAARNINELAAGIEARAKSQMLELVKAIAAEVLRREIAAGNYDMERIVDECLAIARGGERGCLVYLHPHDLESAAAKLEGGGDGRPNITLRADASVSRGSCRVETPYGDILRESNAVLADVIAAMEGRR